MNWALWLTPLVGALIGWFTNYLAVKMIFRPQNPVQFPVIGLTLQGLIPKRKAEIAHSLGEVIERDLVSLDELTKELADGFAGTALVDTLAIQAKEGVVSSFPSLMPSTLKNMAGSLVEKIVRHQAPELMKELAPKALAEVKENISIAQIIEDKINEMQWDTLEDLVLEIASRELRHIEYLGALIGFLIGLIQLLLVRFL